jgi:hypothetical protein
MARIRSIKPDFFTSERVAGLPVTARLTFIGLWTHVDDNGVTVDNGRLITAALWPLEEDPRETLQRTLEDLRRLSEAGLIVRYEAAGKRLLFVRGWDEHQKVSHPGKPRYPRPEAMPPKPPTSADADPDEPEGPSSGESPEDLLSPLETLRPEQGAGSREQGREQGTNTRSRASASSIPRASPDFDRFWSTYPRKEAKGAARKAWDKAIKKTTADAIITAAERFSRLVARDDPRYIAHPATWLNSERWEDQPLPAAPRANGHQPYRDPNDASVYHGSL